MSEIIDGVCYTEIGSEPIESPCWQVQVQRTRIITNHDPNFNEYVITDWEPLIGNVGVQTAEEVLDRISYFWLPTFGDTPPFSSYSNPYAAYDSPGVVRVAVDGNDALINRTEGTFWTTDGVENGPYIFKEHSVEDFALRLYDCDKGIYYPIDDPPPPKGPAPAPKPYEPGGECELWKITAKAGVTKVVAGIKVKGTISLSTTSCWSNGVSPIEKLLRKISGFLAANTKFKLGPVTYTWKKEGVCECREAI